ncbi:MAG TPA: SRPBCC family protein [Thermoanaerobaculia bacterium]|nr:SRPBCC family protein [Thermoanaerobaculia bacterium]
MTTRNEDLGTSPAPGTLRIERLLPGPVERVWAYLTEGAKRGRWLASGELEPRAGGRLELRFHHADLSHEKTPPERFRSMEGGVTSQETVTHWEPPRRLRYTWGNQGAAASEVEFELEPRGDEVLLVLTHRRLRSREDMQGTAAGWHTHLGVLADVLAGREPRGFWSSHAGVEPEYAERLAGAVPYAGAEPTIASEQGAPA